MYIQLNSQIICYERTGDQGTPVILIHGNREDHHIFDPLVERLSKYNVVYAMDSRGHGESATPKEYHYSDMANDVINLIKGLDIEKPYLIGYSDGGIISLLVAMQASELLSGIVCCGANLSPAGLHHRDLREMKKDYKKYNDPRTLMMLQEPDINPEDLKNITVPAMIFAGEDDCVKQKETEKIAQSIPNSVLKILSGENHSSYIVEKDTLYPHIYNFIR
ncbi:alpha/beta hydrolase fold [Pseudobutyrivibrio sp. 49]|uniref:alpha/beta fold hydrolase n=1 Tax=unclassified Pseudobutyrivibrio TaxID=2638619 RepID=UPI000889455A|nr:MULTISPECIES: alpha/beta hydrolase [unclassified Pseudobutyrivibrio]SDI69965.1 alpha/beta hydrolase fold [Pseudobutyrivibrio sp. 49]SFO30960.1 Alpha/beta hydrolase family protein [Pseudobutyrivibrio sp. UC1225]